MTEESKSEKEDFLEVKKVQTKPKRYIGIDACKGFGIWFMLLMHCLMQQEAEFQASLFINVITQISPWWYPLLAPIALLSTWGPFFALAYSITLSIQIQRIIDTKPQEAKKFVFIRLLIGVLILAISKTAGTLFSYRFFEAGHFTIPPIGIYYHAEVLDLIAWSGVIVPCIIWLFYGGLKVKNPYYLILMLFSVIILWVGISPLLTNLGENHVLQWLTDRDLHFLRYFVSKMIRGRFRMFPTLVFGYLGGIYGTMLYHKFIFKKILYTSLILLGICAVGFLLWHFLIEPDWFQNFASETVPMPLLIFNIGTMPFIVLLFLRNQDYAKAEKKRVRAAKRTTWWRRYSLISLTAYSLGTELGYRVFKFFTDAWGASVDKVVPLDPSTYLFAWNFWQLIAFIFTMWVVWEVLIRLWEKINFALSVDWLLIKTTQLITGQKMSRMNLKPIIYGPNMIQEVNLMEPKTSK